MTVLAAEIMGMADWLAKTINYEIIKEVLAGRSGDQYRC